MQVGLKVKTPASAIMMPELIRKVDVFSIVINNLIQYALAYNRQNPNLGLLPTRIRRRFSA